MWTELISKIDEMVGAGMLTSVAVYAMYIDYTGGVVEMCVTGVVALLVTKAVIQKKDDRSWAEKAYDDVKEG